MKQRNRWLDRQREKKKELEVIIEKEGKKKEGEEGKESEKCEGKEDRIRRFFALDYSYDCFLRNGSFIF